MDNLEEKMRAIAQQVYDDNSTQDQFAVAQTPFHKHNGKDSPTFPFTNLNDVPQAYYGNAGRSLVVNATADLLEFSGGVLALTATTGFIYLPTCAGTPTGVPAGGNGATVYDTTANKLWTYNSGWKFASFS